MNQQTVIGTLRQNEAVLKGAGVVKLRLFGSVARNTARHDSDVDLLARFDRTLCRTLFDFAGVEQMISDILSAPVDLTPEDNLPESIREQAEREAILVF